MIIEIAERYLEVAGNINLHPPYYIFLTFVNAKGTGFVVPIRLKLGRPTDNLIAKAETLTMPESIIEETGAAPGKAVKPTFDSVWNTFGFAESHNYDEEGNRQELRR